MRRFRWMSDREGVRLGEDAREGGTGLGLPNVPPLPATWNPGVGALREAEAERAEEAVRDSGAEATTLRSTWFSQNFSESYFLDGLLAGELALPVANTLEPFVDADDIAEVAVAALTDDAHVGEVYELTGPRLLTFSDAVGEIAQATGTEIRYLPVSNEDFATALDEQSVPDEWITLLVYLFQEVLDGRNAHLADGVQRALGREPRDFADYVRDVATTGVWTPALARV